MNKTTTNVGQDVQELGASYPSGRSVKLCLGGHSVVSDTSGLPFSPPGNLPDPGIKLKSPASPALVGRFFTTMSLGDNGTMLKKNSLEVPQKG